MVSKKVTTSLAEIVKRVPPNQIKQFEELSKKHANYSRRMNKYPEKLPKISWEDYKAQVSKKSLKLINDFEKKYEDLNKMFDERDKLDHSKYYVELEKQKTEVEREIACFKEESEERIKVLEAELNRLKNLKPYKEMTMEEFCILQPEKAKYIPYYGNNELFWPFTPEEQLKNPKLVAEQMQNSQTDADKDKTKETKPKDDKNLKKLTPEKKS